MRRFICRLLSLTVTVALLAANVSDLRAQPAATLSGRVTDSATQAVLRGASVTLTPASSSASAASGATTLRTATDADGEFTVVAPAGDYTLALDYLGLPPKFQAVTLPAPPAAPVRLAISLGDSTLALAAVTVESSRTGQARAGVWFTPERHAQLAAWVRRHYRDRLAPADLADPALLEESRRALDELTRLLGFGPIYPFQREPMTL